MNKEENLKPKEAIDPYEGWVKCCYECKNRSKDQNECYEGKPYFKCPLYQKV